MSPTETEEMEERKEEVTKTQSIPCTLQTLAVQTSSTLNIAFEGTSIEEIERHIVKGAKH